MKKKIYNEFYKIILKLSDFTSEFSSLNKLVISL